jgi:hypothetical protein
MDLIDKQQSFSVLVMLTMAFFVASGVVAAEPWRRRMRIAAICFLAVALVLVLLQIAAWLLGVAGNT